MSRCHIFLCIITLLASVASQEDPTVYEYYTSGGIRTGLEALSSGFQLNGKNITIQSGSIHYFRVHPKLWRDRLKKLRSTGLIAVETYVPWNLNEPAIDEFDFGNGNRDFSEFLNLPEFLKIAQEEDLLVLLRPGPYIGAEWEMGGLPSWLMNFPDIKIRTSEKQYSDRVANYFNRLLPLVAPFQFQHNGSIIAVQLENEYSSVGYAAWRDRQYLQNLKSLIQQNKIKELLYTSDNTMGEGSLPGVLRTINFQSDPQENLKNLSDTQPDKPTMVMEYWTGWYDYWMKPVQRLNFSPQEYRDNLEAIMKFPASFNLYMFHGGTSFGFMNGAFTNTSKSATNFEVTSYDYDAPLSESGDYTEKYYHTKDLVSMYQPIKFKLPQQPEPSPKTAYPAIQPTKFLTMQDSLLNEKSTSSQNVINMEKLNTNKGSGQSYGYALYQKEGLSISKNDVIKITGYVHDVAQVLVDDQLQQEFLDLSGFGSWRNPDQELSLISSGTALSILVENYGRENFGINTYDDKKGLHEGPVLINGEEISDWEIYPLEMDKSFMERLSRNSNWQPIGSLTNVLTPRFYSFTLNLDSDPADTFLDTTDWSKGVVFVNGFNLGRYNKKGPQQRLYLPAPFIKKGDNEIILFEQYAAGKHVSFYSEPKLGRD